MGSFSCMLMKRLQFPHDAADFFINLEDKINNSKVLAEFDKLVEAFMSQALKFEDIAPWLKNQAEQLNVHHFSLDMYFFIKCAPILLELYRKNNIDEGLFWDTIADLKYKAMECMNVYEIWGTFVSSWFPPFFNLTRFALGRFQYEQLPFPYERYEKGNNIILKNDVVYNMHIPSSGVPLSKEIRLDSYKRAYSFYQNNLQGRPMFIVCNSWLLYPKHRDFLPPDSNILDFMGDFDIIHSEEFLEFDNAWRIFGKHGTLPPNQWPQETSLQKAYKKRILEGKKVGNGYGIIVFDGEKIL